MKKTILFISMLAMTMCFVACSSDDNEEKVPEEVKDPYNGHEYVDLGLPSGLKWATCNVGATMPEECGDYYAWGETETKSIYDWSNYIHCNGSVTTLTKYCTDSKYGTVDNKDVLESSDDVAHVKWGGNWRMPTKAEIEELSDKNNCEWTWTTQNGVKGYQVTSTKNGNSIFLPVTGYRDGSTLLDAGSKGYYWSNSLYSSTYGAYYLSASDSNYWGIGRPDSHLRYYGRPVRAVCP